MAYSRANMFVTGYHMSQLRYQFITNLRVAVPSPRFSSGGGHGYT